jgi:hypothetical protein
MGQPEEVTRRGRFAVDRAGGRAAKKILELSFGANWRKFAPKKARAQEVQRQRSPNFEVRPKIG